MAHDTFRGVRPAQGFQAQGLYLPEFEHDACGVGFIAHIKAKASHKLVNSALEILEHMEHRGAVGCEPDIG